MTPTVEIEIVLRTVNAALPLVGSAGLYVIGEMLQTCCVRCDVRDTCDVAFDPYNQGCEPKIDCLAAK